jgi:general secretion pathway protein D
VFRQARPIAAGALLGALIAGCSAGPVREVEELPSTSIPPSVAEAPQRANQPNLPSAQPGTRPGTQPQSGLNTRPRGGQLGSRTVTQPMIDELYLGGGKPVDAKAPQPPRGPRNVGDITLDFKDADIQEVARVILGDLLKANYAIDPDVSGAVTLQTGKPITRQALIPALEAVLEGRGARLVAYGNIYRVTRQPGIAAAAMGGVGVGPIRIPDGAGLRVFPLEYINAEEMAKILQPTLPEGAVAVVDPARNLVMVAGTGPELALASGTVSIFDVDQMAGQSVLLTSLENVDAGTMVAELEGVFAAGGKGGPRGPVRFIPVERLNAVMVIARQVRYIEEARHWIYRLDRTRSANEQRLFVYYVQNGRAADLAKTLRGVFADGSVVEASDSAQRSPLRRPTVTRTELDYKPTATSTGVSGGGTAQPPGTFLGPQPAGPPGTPAAAAAAGGVASGELAALARGAQGAGAGGAAPGAPGRLGGAVRITADDKNNALLIAATPRDFELVQDVLDKLDLVPLQVLIEATIFEVTLRDQLRFGLQYLISNGGLGFANDGSAILTRGTDLNNLAGAAQSTLPGFAFTLNGTDRVRFVLDALSEITDVNVISSPHMLVLDNQEARLQVGDEVPIITQSATSTLTSNPLIVNTVQYRNTGVTLEVTPRVNAGGLVTLDIAQEVSDVQQTTSSTINSPTIQQRRLVSTVAIQDAETIMLGGLIREDSQQTRAGIPVLHRIPIIGAMFGTTNNTARRTELLVLITPRVIASAQDARDVTQDMRRKFLNLLKLQAEGVQQPRRINKDNVF